MRLCIWSVAFRSRSCLTRSSCSHLKSFAACFSCVRSRLYAKASPTLFFIRSLISSSVRCRRRKGFLLFLTLMPSVVALVFRAASFSRIGNLSFLVDSIADTSPKGFIYDEGTGFLFVAFSSPSTGEMAGGDIGVEAGAVGVNVVSRLLAPDSG